MEVAAAAADFPDIQKTPCNYEISPIKCFVYEFINFAIVIICLSLCFIFNSFIPLVIFAFICSFRLFEFFELCFNPEETYSWNLVEQIYQPNLLSQDEYELLDTKIKEADFNIKNFKDTKFYLWKFSHKEAKKKVKFNENEIIKLKAEMKKQKSLRNMCKLKMFYGMPKIFMEYESKDAICFLTRNFNYFIAFLEGKLPPTKKSENEQATLDPAAAAEEDGNPNESTTTALSIFDCYFDHENEKLEKPWTLKEKSEFLIEIAQLSAMFESPKPSDFAPSNSGSSSEEELCEASKKQEEDTFEYIFETDNEKSKEPMTYEEKQKLSLEINALPEKYLNEAKEILKKYENLDNFNPNEFEIDFATFKESTLEELEDYLNGVSKSQMEEENRKAQSFPISKTSKTKCFLKVEKNAFNKMKKNFENMENQFEEIKKCFEDFMKPQTDF